MALRVLVGCSLTLDLFSVVFGGAVALLPIFAASGMGDMVSVVIRSTLLQARTPEGMLGRVSSVNQIFIGSSGEIGMFESGVTARWWGPVGIIARSVARPSRRCDVACGR